MKKMTLKSVLKYGVISFVILGLFGLASSALAATSGSVDLMCRSKAKEIAAETYKNCVTDIKQSQVKNLRKEYETKLAALKKHYDNELKKISSGQIDKTKQVTPPKGQNEIDLNNNTDESSIEIVEIPAEQE